MDNDFEEYIEYCKKNGIKLECPFGCSCYGFLCDGDPYTTPCGRAIEVEKKGETTL